MAYRISIDTGGTFTDVVVSDSSGAITLGKALTTHDRIFLGMREGMLMAANQIGLSLGALLDQTELLIYGTTRATNAIVEGKVAKTAFVTTEGFPDTLVYKEGGKTKPHDFSRDYPEPFIPRRHTYEVRERIDAEGGVATPFDEAHARAVIETLRREKFEAVAVCFLWSINNPDHELAFAALLDEHLPGVPYTLSHQALPIIREYRRASATAIDASLKPLMQKHLQEMNADLRDNGLRGRVLVSTSMGGCLNVEELIERPIQTTKSGPAMAPVAGRAYARMEAEEGDVIICDTGGTTFDLGLVRAGEVVFTRETWIGEQWGGHIVATSAVDVRSIGAGGGSIAWIDPGGLLRVGPQSAGSEPGPACYCRGGNLPTVTDAALVLGYLDPEYFLGGRMTLDLEASRRVIGDLGKRLDLDAEDTAWSIIRIANELMIKAIQEICITEGVNPRESTIVAGGGAAGLNILPIAGELGARTVILPKTAGALSACGMQYSDIVREASASHVTRSNEFDHAGVSACLNRIQSQLSAFIASMKDQGFAEADITLSVEARYLGQVWELDTVLPSSGIETPRDLEALVENFHQVHERVLGVRDPASPLECLNWKGKARVRLGRQSTITATDASPHQPAPHSTRNGFFGKGWEAVPVFHGVDLDAGAMITGPAVIEEPTTTIVVYPGFEVTLTKNGNYVSRLKAA